MHSAQRQVAKMLKDPGTSAGILCNRMKLNEKMLRCNMVAGARWPVWSRQTRAQLRRTDPTT